MVVSLFFFFKQKTAYEIRKGDWSSDVCSSDLNPNMQRVMEDTSYANSIEIYLERCRGDVWTLEMKDRNQRDLELFEPIKHDLKKKICIGAVSHRSLQADRPEDVAGEIRKALK